MVLTSSQPHVTAAAIVDEQDISRAATCPMCHTPASLALSALEAAGGWRCVRCGQRWDAAQLATAAAYAEWVVAHDAAAAMGGERATPALPAEPPGGRT